MATFNDIRKTAERISFQVSYLEKTKQTLDEILDEWTEPGYATVYVHVGDGSTMELYDVPKEVIKNLVTEYRINKLRESIKEGKKEIAEMVEEVVTEY